MKSYQIAPSIGSWTVAYEMLRRGMRPPLVAAATGLPASPMRELFTEMTGQRPPNGPAPNNSGSYIKRQRAAIQANLFFLAYYKEGGEDIFRHARPEVVLAAYDSYRKYLAAMDIKNSDSLTFTATWFIARDLRSQELEKRYCRSCRLHHLYSLANTCLHGCPFCNAHLRARPQKTEDVADAIAGR